MRSSHLLWEVWEIRHQREENLVAKFRDHEDAVDYQMRQVKRYSGTTIVEFDVRQGKKEPKGKWR